MSRTEALVLLAFAAACVVVGSTWLWGPLSLIVAGVALGALALLSQHGDDGGP